MNRRCSSHTVLTGSPGTIALTDPSDWVHMRIKTLSLPLFEFFLFSFLLALLLPTVSLTLTFSLYSLPLTRSPSLHLTPAHGPSSLPHFLLPSSLILRFLRLSECFYSVFECGEALGLHCWSDHVPKTSVKLRCPEPICHQGGHCYTYVPLPSGAELETLKCVSSILLFFKAKFWYSPCNLRVPFQWPSSVCLKGFL